MTEVVTGIGYHGASTHDCCEMADDFFTERADQSEVKARIVSNYFVAWARIIAPRTMLSDGKVVYIDLFAGPGRYEDGSASTPLMILSRAIEIPNLRDSLVSIFNDADENHTATLANEIAKLSGVNTLKYPPDVHAGEVGRPVAEYFENVRLIPTFSFIDPFGYKGLSWALIRSVIKDWGSDCVSSSTIRGSMRGSQIARFSRTWRPCLVKTISDACAIASRAVRHRAKK